MDRPGVSAGTGSPALRCVFEEYRGIQQSLKEELPLYRPCGRPGVGMFEQKPYCDEHIEAVAQERRTQSARKANDQASQAD
jgi:hypothetical protein